jgi:hypothetical protein
MSWFERSKTSPPRLRLFRLNIHLGRGRNAEMPANLIGAFVPVFVAALDHEAAAHAAVSNLTGRGFEFLDIVDRKIVELDPTTWDEFVRENWPDFVSHFPSQSEVQKGLQSEFLFTGPLASYDTPANA